MKKEGFMTKILGIALGCVMLVATFGVVLPCWDTMECFYRSCLGNIGCTWIPERTMQVIITWASPKCHYVIPQS